MSREIHRGFASERTIGFALVKRLAVIFPDAVPIYFWAQRKGGRLAAADSNFKRVQIISCFARRPKIHRPGDPAPHVKFSSSIFQSSRVAKNLQIPTLVGVPIANQLSSLLGCDFQWYEVNLRNERPMEFTVPISQKCVSENGSVQAISELAVTNLRMTGAKWLEWARAREAMALIRSASRGESRFPIGGYTPFFLLFGSNA